MNITGPFLPNVNYIGDIYKELSKNDRFLAIEISDTNLYKYRYLSFKFKQNLHRFHNESVFVYMQYKDRSEMMQVKPTPTQVFEYIEYRIRLSSEKFQGTNFVRFMFVYHGLNTAEIWLTDLKFGPNVDTEEVYIPLGFVLQTIGGGLTSPFPGYIPVSVNEIVDIGLFNYNGSKLKHIEIIGDIYDENGNKYPRFVIPERYMQVQYINPFENCRMLAVFGEDHG